jgi:hypothetical protein
LNALAIKKVVIFPDFVVRPVTASRVRLLRRILRRPFIARHRANRSVEMLIRDLKVMLRRDRGGVAYPIANNGQWEVFRQFGLACRMEIMEVFRPGLDAGSLRDLLQSPSAVDTCLLFSDHRSEAIASGGGLIFRQRFDGKPTDHHFLPGLLPWPDDDIRIGVCGITRRVVVMTDTLQNGPLRHQNWFGELVLNLPIEVEAGHI